MKDEKICELKPSQYSEHILVVTIVDSAYSGLALNAARLKGARACTIIHGRGKHIGQKPSIFGPSPDTSRDFVLAAAHKDDAQTVMEGIFEAVGLRTDGHGFVYQLPISSFGGFLSHHHDGKLTEECGPPGRYGGGDDAI